MRLIDADVAKKKTNCGTVQGITCIAMDYCPHCGAQMVQHPWAASGCGQAFSPD